LHHKKIYLKLGGKMIKRRVKKEVGIEKMIREMAKMIEEKEG